MSDPLRGSSFIMKQFFMGPTEINLYVIADGKVDFILLQKMYAIPRLGSFVLTTNFAQCGFIDKFFYVFFSKKLYWGL